MANEQLRKLDQTLQELALTNFEYFCRIAGVDKAQAQVCLERGKGKSLQQIANKLKMPKSTVAFYCKKCGQ